MLATHWLPIVIGVALVSGCVSSAPPMNLEANLYDREKSRLNSHIKPHTKSHRLNQCPAAGTASFMMPSALGRKHKRKRKVRIPPMQYSPGDRFNILILDSPEFSGDYAVNLDGRVILPFAGQIKAAGLTNAQLARRISRTLVRKGIFTKQGSRVSVRPIQYAPVNVTVTGAVFAPGRHVINHVRAAEKSVKFRTKSGDNSINRMIPAALQAAGGVRPDADLTKVTVSRDGKLFNLDWRGAFTGQRVDDLPLIEGDHIEVGEADCFQSALVRPSQITPSGVKIFVSNLTAPALNNASGVQHQNASGGVPYGTRFLKGIVQANCVGGSYSTNAKRHAVLISRNPKTGKTEVIQRSVEDLVRRADRDTINPFLMPNDAIVCYDSAVTEFRDAVSILGNIVGSAGTVRTF